MGAQTFQSSGYGKTAKEVFTRLVSEAKYEYGHGGYTGSIAEKDSFVEVTKPADMDLETFIDKQNDTAFYDKWGAAGCVKTGKVDKNNNPQFVFFGWASC